MVDTTTPILGLLLQGTGSNNNAWGVNLNNSVIQPIELAVKGLGAITVTAGTRTLTQAELAYGTVMLNGTIGSDLIVTVPGVTSRWTFYNNTSGAGYVIIRGPGGAQRNLPRYVWLDIVCDGSNVYRQDAHMIGTYFYHAGVGAPSGSFECNGATVSRASLPDLFAQIGGVHGAPDGSTFSLPNGYFNGGFLRSRSGTVGAATYQNNQNLSHTHTFTGALTHNFSVSSGDGTHTHQGTTDAMDRTSTHSHGVSAGVKGGTLNAGLQAGGSNIGPVNIGGASGDITINATDINHLHTFTTNTIGSGHNHTISGGIGLGTVANVSDGGAEARPNSITGILCVWY